MLAGIGINVENAIIDGHGATYFADIALCEEMRKALWSYYPRHYFFIECNHDKTVGVMTIQLLYEDAKKIRKKWRHGMLIHIDNLQTLEGIKNYARRFGGELLERYNFARAGANPYTWIDAQTHNLDLTGIV